jgi:preprotein translocase subunit SecE
MTKPSSKSSNTEGKAAKTVAAERRGATRAPARTGRGAAVTEAGGRLPRFLREVRVEMGKVTWPARPELIQSTLVVLIAIVIAAIYIGLWDLIWSQLVSLARLG